MRWISQTTRVLLWVLVLTFVLSVTACNLFGGRERTGSLVIRTNGVQASSRNTYSPGNTTITQVRILGFGPNTVDTVHGAEVVVPASQTLMTINDLVTGQWTFVVVGENSDEAPVLSGSQMVTIENNETAEAEITLEPVEGDGSLVVEFRWPTASLQDPSVVALLSPYLNGGFDPEETVELGPFEGTEIDNVTTHRYTGTHGAGYYELRSDILDGVVSVRDRTDTVRILKNFQTQVIINLETGNVDITIVLDPQDPLTVSLSVDGDLVIPEGTNITVNAEVSGGTAPYEYRWYAQGTVLAGADGPQLIYGNTLAPGRYRISLVAADGTVLGSDSIAFDVVQ